MSLSIGQTVTFTNICVAIRIKEDFTGRRNYDTFRSKEHAGMVYGNELWTTDMVVFVYLYGA
jgi:hypothetical protein